MKAGFKRSGSVLVSGRNWFLLLSFWFLGSTMVSPALLAQTKPYRGAELRTNATYRYGRFEVRLKSASGSGLLSSFFTFYDGGGLPANWNEIDIEILGRYADQVQYNVISPGQINHVQSKTLWFNPHQAFHTYTIDWTPDYVAWGVDGMELYRQYGEHIAQIERFQKIMMNIWPPAYPDWVGTLDPNILPRFAFYDWVSYYRYTPGSRQRFTLEWRDDFDRWDTARWAKATHTWDGNNSNFIPENAVFQDGYLILCLTTPTHPGYSGAPIVDADVDPPHALRARSFSTYIEVIFSEPVDSLSASNPNNYLLPGASVQSAVLQPDGRTVHLSVENLDPNTNYNLIVSGIQDLAQPPHTSPLEHLVVQTTPTLPIHINAGGGAWNDYRPDQRWYDSLAYGWIGGTAVNHPELTVQGTTESELYRSELRGLSFYQVRLPRGYYRITLKFAETEYDRAGLRVFDVYAEGRLLQENLDIFARVGANHALEITLPDLLVEDGLLELYFQPVSGEPLLSALNIEAVPNKLFRGENPLPGLRWQIFPNPFNGRATVAFTLTEPSAYRITLYDLTGRRVKTVSALRQPAGDYRVPLNFERLGSGVYFCELQIDSRFRAVKKVVFVK